MVDRSQLCKFPLTLPVKVNHTLTIVRHRPAGHPLGGATRPSKGHPLVRPSGGAECESWEGRECAAPAEPLRGGLCGLPGDIDRGQAGRVAASEGQLCNFDLGRFRLGCSFSWRLVTGKHKKGS